MRRLLLLICLTLCALRFSDATGQDNAAPTPSPSSTAAVAVPPVWVNIPSKIYHYADSRWYGRTHSGKYLSETDAIAEGDRAAHNEHHRTSPPPPRASPPLPPDTPAASATPSATAASQHPPADAAPSAELLQTCITAIAAQSDPAKLATLSLHSRAANPRLKRILYYLAQARAAGADPGDVIAQAQQKNGSAGTPRAPLVKASLLWNLKICDGLGLLTENNLAGLRRGQAPTVTRGPYAWQKAEVDHIVPLARAPQVGNELANLEILPATLNRAKSAKVGERQLALARKFRDAGLISEAALASVQARFRPAGTAKYELPEE